MQLNWFYTTILSIFLFAVHDQASAQYTSSSSVYTPPPSSPYVPPPSSPYPPTCVPTTLIVTSVTPTTITSITTTTAFETIYSQYPYSYDNTYIPPMKKKTGLIIGLVVGLCGLALLLLIAFLLFKRHKKSKVEDYGKGSKTYDEPGPNTYSEGTTPATSY